VGQRFVLNLDTMSAQGGDGAFQIHSIPEDDGSNDEIEAAGAVALVLEASIAQVSLSAKKDRTREISREESSRKRAAGLKRPFFMESAKGYGEVCLA
jgi:hypothetical protein